MEVRHPCDKGVQGRGFNCLLREAIPVSHSSRGEAGQSVLCSAGVLSVSLVITLSGSSLLLELQLGAIYSCLLVGDLVEHGQMHYPTSLFEGWPAE